MDELMMDIRSLEMHFPITGGLFKRTIGAVKAVDGVSLYIKKGETFGLVGESGCGKTTLGRAVLNLIIPTSGYALYNSPLELHQLLNKLDEIKRQIASSDSGQIPPNLTKELKQTFQKLEKYSAREDTELRKTIRSKSGSAIKRKAKLSEDLKRIESDISNLSGSQPHKEGVDGHKKCVTRLLRHIREAEDRVLIQYSLKGLKKRERRRLTRKMQIVFQDPFSSLNPRMLIKNIVSEPLIVHRRLLRKEIADKAATAEAKDKEAEEALTFIQNFKIFSAKEFDSKSIRLLTIKMLESVGLNQEHLYRYPHEFSGGQRQRIGIARALIVNPDFVVLDEPTSALDVSVQAQILNKLNDLQDELNLTYLFISHDLSTIRYMCDRIAVMYLGKIVESAPKKDLFANPTHPYTEALLSVIPVPDPDLKKNRIILAGEVPSPANPPSGCGFHTRCPLAIERCKIEEPPLTDRGDEHFVACHVR